MHIIFCAIKSNGYVEGQCQVIAYISEDIVNGLGTQHNWWQPGTSQLKWPRNSCDRFVLAPVGQLSVTATRSAVTVRCIQIEGTFTCEKKVHLSIHEIGNKMMNLILRTLFKDFEKWHLILLVRRYTAHFWPFPRTWSFLPSGAAASSRF